MRAYTNRLGRDIELQRVIETRFGSIVRSVEIQAATFVSTFAKVVGPPRCLEIDVLDSTDRWLQASLIGVADFPDGPMLYVHYTGWDHSYDDWLPIESYRLAMPGTRCTAWTQTH